MKSNPGEIPRKTKNVSPRMTTVKQPKRAISPRKRRMGDSRREYLKEKILPEVI